MLAIDETIEQSAEESIAGAAAGPPAATCIGFRRDGSRCMAKARPASAYCIGHDPELAERRHAGRVKGGHGRSNLARASKRLGAGALSLGELDGALSQLLRGLVAGAVDPSNATAAAALARAIAGIKMTADLAERVAALEAEGLGDER